MSNSIDLNAQILIPNLAKIVISDFLPNDALVRATMKLTLRTGNASDSKVCEFAPFTIFDTTTTDTFSDQWERQTSPALGLNIEDINRYIIRATRSTPTGYTDLMNAWKAGATPAARMTALKAHLMSALHLGSTLAGT